MEIELFSSLTRREFQLESDESYTELTISQLFLIFHYFCIPADISGFLMFYPVLPPGAEVCELFWLIAQEIARPWELRSASCSDSLLRKSLGPGS